MKARFATVLEFGLLAVACWSVVGVIIALVLDAPGAAKDFIYAMLGSGVTLLALDYLARRRHG